MNPRIARFIVLGPTVLLSYELGNFGFPLGPRIAVTIGLGLILIMLVARYQRRRRTI